MSLFAIWFRILADLVDTSDMALLEPEEPDVVLEVQVVELEEEEELEEEQQVIWISATVRVHE
jgi:hypothetical protein